MKKATKILALLLTLAMVVGMFAACGANTPAVKVVNINLTDEEYAFGVDKDQPELLEQVNAFIAEIKANGKLEEIFNNYFGDGTPKAIKSAALDESKDQLVVATNAEFPPYEYHDGGDIVGIDVEVAEAIAGKLGMTLEVEDIAFHSIIPELESGKADIGVAGMTVNEDRLKNVDFTDPYTTASQVIIVKEDSEIAGPDDLKGKYIGVQLGTTGDIYASDYEADGSTIERYNKGFEAVQAMQQGKIDAVVIDQEPAKVFVSQNEGIKILDEALTVEEYAIAVKKGNTELLDQVNGALAELKESGELQAIIDKYISAE